MLIIFKRGTTVRIMRGVVMVTTRDVVGTGPCIMFHHGRGDGIALSRKYIKTYDAVVACSHDFFHWILDPGLTDCSTPPDRFLPPSAKERRQLDG